MILISECHLYKDGMSGYWLTSPKSKNYYLIGSEKYWMNKQDIEDKWGPLRLVV